MNQDCWLWNSNSFAVLPILIPVQKIIDQHSIITIIKYIGNLLLPTFHKDDHSTHFHAY